MKSNLEKLSTIVGKIKTPLTLSGLVVVVLYALYQQVLSLPVFENIGANATFSLLQNILDKLFWLAVMAIILGVSSYLIIFYQSRKKTPSSSNVSLIDASLDPHDSNYEQVKKDKKTSIHPKGRKK